MNPWLVTAFFLLAALGGCGIVCFRGTLWDRLAGLEAAGVVVTLLLLALSELFKRPELMDLSIAAGLLGFGGGLAFIRFIERWL